MIKGGTVTVKGGNTGSGQNEGEQFSAGIGINESVTLQGGTLTVSGGIKNQINNHAEYAYGGTVTVANGHYYTFDGANGAGYTGLLCGELEAPFSDSELDGKTLKPAKELTIPNSITGGTVTSDKTAEEPYVPIGATVTLIVTPATTYQLKELTVTKTGESSTTVEVGGTGDTRTFTMPDYDVTVSATFVKAPVSTSYIDASGEGKTVNAIPLDNTDTEIGSGMIEKWYVVNSNTHFTEPLLLKGNVNIILVDGKTLTFGSENNRITAQYCILSGYDNDDHSNTKYDLKIYGQSGGTGAMTMYCTSSYAAINVDDYYQYGGKVTIDNTNSTGIGIKTRSRFDLNLYKGELSVTSAGQYAINAETALITDAKVTAKTTGSSGCAIYISSGINITNSDVNATATGTGGCAIGSDNPIYITDSKVTATGAEDGSGIKTDTEHSVGFVNLSLSGADHFVKASNYVAYAVNVVALKYLTDDAGNFYGGAATTALTTAQVTAIANKKLIPAYGVGISSSIEHGTITASPKGFRKDTFTNANKTVTLTIAPDSSYTLKTLSITGDTSGNTITPTEGSDGEYTFTMPDENVTVSATFEQPAVAYLDASGQLQSCTSYTALTGGDGGAELAEGWYVVPKGTTAAYGGTLTLNGDVDLILEDGATLNVGEDGNPVSGIGINSNGYDLTVYGQTTNETTAGTLKVYSSSNNESNCGGISLTNAKFTLNGGNVLVSSTGDEGNGIYGEYFIMNGGRLDVSSTKHAGIYTYYDITINGGTANVTGYDCGLHAANGSVIINGGSVTASVTGTPGPANPAIYTENGKNSDSHTAYSTNSITINGGNVTANSTIKANGQNDGEGSIILGFSNAADSIKAAGYIAGDLGDVKVADGKCLTVDGTTAYYGTLTSAQLTAIADKKLVPAYGVIIDNNITNGTVSASPAAFPINGFTDLTNEEKECTLTINPEQDYTLGSVNIDGHSYSIEGNTMSFTMPADNVTVSATFLKSLNCDDISIEDIADQTYTGSAITPSVTVKDGGAELEQGKDYTVSYKDNVNAAAKGASAAPTVSITGKGSYSGEIEETFTILPKSITIKAADQSVELNKAIATSKDKVSITSDTIVDGHTLASFSLGLAEGTNTSTVGEYTNAIVPGAAVIKDAFGNNVTANYDITYVNGKLTVTKIKAKVTVVPTVKTNLQYTGTAQALITAGAADTAMEYALGESDTTAPTSGYSETVPSQSDAKTYYVWYRAKADDNHEAGDAAELTVSIAKADPEIVTKPTASSITYGQALSQSSLSNGAAKLGETPIEGEFDWSDQMTTPVVSDSEKTEYTVVFTPTDSNNINNAACKVTLIVNKADIPANKITHPQANTNLSYTGSPIRLITEGSCTLGDMYYAAADSGLIDVPGFDGTDDIPDKDKKWTTAVPTGKDAGGYKVWYLIKADGNHNDTEATYIEVEIARGDYSGTKEASAIVRSQQTTENAQLTLPVLPEGASYSSTGTAGGTTPSLISGTPSVSGRVLTFSTTEQVDQTTATIKVNVSGAKNYKDYDVVVTVTARDKDDAEITINGGAAVKTATYGDAAFTLSKSVKNPGTVGTGKWTWTTDDTENRITINEDTGLITIKKAFSDPITINAYYESETTIGDASIALKVNRASLTVRANDAAITYGDSPTNNSVTYSGFVYGQGAGVLTGSLQYTYGYSRYGSPGRYSISIDQSDLASENYSISYASGTLSVSQRTVGLSWSSLSFPYNGSSQGPTAQASGLVNGDSCTVSVTGLGVVPGTYRAEATGLSNSCYQLPSGTSVSFTITKAPAVLTVGQTSYTKAYGDPAFPLEGISSTNTETEIVCTVVSGENVVSVSGRTVNIKGTGTARIRISQPAGNLYEEAVSRTVSVTVGKKSFTPPVLEKTYPYSVGGTERIDLEALLPEDFGAAKFTVASSGSIVYSEAPVVSERGALTYALKEQASVSDSGSITVKAATTNYSDISFTVRISLTDQKALKLKQYSKVKLKNLSLTYGSHLSALQFYSCSFVDAQTNTSVRGVLDWKDPSMIPAAGTASAAWIYTPDDKTYAPAEGFIAISVYKADPVVAELPVVRARVYDPGQALLDSDIIGGTVKDAQGRSLSGSWSFCTSGLVPAAGMNTAEIRFTPFDTNYNAITKQVMFNVSKATPLISFPSGSVSIDYGQKLSDAEWNARIVYGNGQGSSGTGPSALTKVSGKLAWERPEEVPTVKDSKKTKYRAVFSPEDSANYNAMFLDLTVEVNKSNAPYRPEVTELTASPWMTAVKEVELPATALCWEWDNGEQTLETGSNSCTARYKGPGAGNYENETVSIKVNKEEGTVISLWEKVKVNGKTTEEKRYTKELTIGKGCTLYTKFESGNAGRIIWASSNPAVATVDRNGKINAVSAGKTAITAFCEEDPAVKASCEVKVLEPVKSITLSENSHKLVMGQSFTLNAEVLPFNADKNLTWKSSDEAVAKVVPAMSADGSYCSAVVTTGSKKGTAHITAVASDGTAVKKICKVSVGNPIPDFTIAPNNDKAIAKVGDVLAFNLTWAEKAVDNKDVTLSVTDENGDPTSAAIINDKGQAIGTGEGLVKLTAVSKADPSKSASCLIKVYVPLQSAALNYSSATLSSAKGSLQLSVEAVSKVGEPVTGITLGSLPKVVYSLDPKDRVLLKYPGLITVDPATGLVSLNVAEYERLTAAGVNVAGNKVPVYADLYTFNGTEEGIKKRLSCAVTIAQSNPLKAIKVSKSTVHLGEGNSCTVTAAVSPANPDSGSDIVWSILDAEYKDYLSINPSEDGASCVITAKEGAAKAVGKSVSIRVASKALRKYYDGSFLMDSLIGQYSPIAYTRVYVHFTPSMAGIELTNLSKMETACVKDGVAYKQLAEGKSFTVQTKLSYTGSGAAATNALKWESSNPGLVSVSDKGVVKVLAAGTLSEAERTVTITVCSADEKAVYSGSASKTTAMSGNVPYTTGVRADGIPYASFSFTVWTPVKSTSVDKTKLTLGTAEGSRYGKIAITKILPAAASNQVIRWTADNANVQVMAVPKNTNVDLDTFAAAHDTDKTTYTDSELKKLAESLTGAGETAAYRKGFIPVSGDCFAETGADEALAIRALTPGTVTLTGITTDGTKQKVSCTITVRGQVTGILYREAGGIKENGTAKPTAELNRYVCTIAPGKGLSLTPRLTINNVRSDDAQKTIYAAYKKYTDTTVFYRSSDTKTATVSISGRITVNKKPAADTVVIYATSSDGTHIAELTVSVK